MTTNDAVPAVYPFPITSAGQPGPMAETALTRPMPRLGRGIVWSDIVAEIERDNEARMRDAA
jgi:hypothetical protein